MTVSTSSYAPTEYAGNGATTAFPSVWPFYELTVTLISALGIETLWTEGTHYTVSHTPPNSTGTIGTVTVITTPTDYTPAAGTTLRLDRVTVQSQSVEMTDSGPFPATSNETALDRLTMIAQEHRLDIDTVQADAEAAADVALAVAEAALADAATAQGIAEAAQIDADAALAIALGLAPVAASGSATDLTAGTLPAARLPNALLALHPLTPAADKAPYYTAAGAAALATLTSFGRELIETVNKAAARDLLNIYQTVYTSGVSGVGVTKPTIIGTATAGTATYSVQEYDYTVVDDLIGIRLVLLWTGHTGTGNLRVDELPFFCKTGAEFNAPLAVQCVGLGSDISAYVLQSTKNIIVMSGDVTCTMPGSGAGTLRLNGSYRRP